jgi:hypothetical protein
MIRGLGRAAAAGVLAALASATWLVLFYGRAPAVRMDFDLTPPPSVASGVYPSERDPASGLTFAWMTDTLRLELPGLDRRVDWILDVRVRGGRPDPAANPDLRFSVDGAPVLARRSANEFEVIRIPIHRRPAEQGVTISIGASSTFVPGPTDSRELGVMLDSISITPVGIVVPPWRAFTGMMLASAALAASIAFLGVTAGSAVAAAVLVGAALAALVARGLGPYSTFPSVAARTALAVGFVTAALSAGLVAIRRQPFRNTAKFTIAFTASALLLELLVLLHPDMPYSTGTFQQSARLTLLRMIVCSTYAAAGLLLYGMVVRAVGDRLTGALAVALYHLIPIGFGAMAAGYLRETFALSMAVAALALIAAGTLRFEHRASVALLALTLAGAFHFDVSAFVAIVSVATCLIALLFWWQGGPVLRSPAAAILTALVIAVLLTAAFSVARLNEAFPTVRPAADAGFESATRGETVVRIIPSLALACWGAVVLWRRGVRDRLTLSIAGWSAACLAFLILDILAVVDVRYNLASIPAMALLAGIGASAGWTAGGLRRAVAIGLLGWALVIGVRAWWIFDAAMS